MAAQGVSFNQSVIVADTPEAVSQALIASAAGAAARASPSTHPPPQITVGQRAAMFKQPSFVVTP